MMIITCEKCSTKFNLDESLLDENGSKVRCSICKHIFTAYPSDGKREDEAFDRIYDASDVDEAGAKTEPVKSKDDDSGESDKNYKSEDKHEEEKYPDLQYDSGDADNEQQLDDNFDIDNIDNLDLDLSLDNLDPEAGLDLEDIEIRDDFSDKTEVKDNSNDIKLAADIDHFDSKSEPEPEFESEPEIVVKPESDSELGLEQELALESEPDSELQLEDESETEFSIESESEQEYEFDFDDNFDEDEFELTEQAIKDEIEESSSSEENFELELDLESNDEQISDVQTDDYHLIDDFESDKEKKENADISLEYDADYGDDIDIDDDTAGDKKESADKLEDELELDFSEFEISSEKSDNLEIEPELDIEPEFDFDMEFEDDLEGVDQEIDNEISIDIDTDKDKSDSRAKSDNEKAYKDKEIDKDANNKAEKETDDGLEFSEFIPDAGEDDDDISLEFEEIPDGIASDKTSDLPDNNIQTSEIIQTDEIGSSVPDTEDYSSNYIDKNKKDEMGNKQGTEEETNARPSLADLSAELAIDNDIKKPAKQFGKPVFIILALLILILAGYSVSIMQGINIPYLSNIKIPFLTNYLSNYNHNNTPIQLTPDKKSVNGRFVTNQSAGTLFVITGKIKNNSTIPCSYIRVTGTLITKDKTKIKKKTVFCGNFIPEDKLETLKMEDINIILNRKSGINNSNMNIAPGKSVSFMIVFSKLPDNLANFTVNVAGFQKGIGKK